MADHLREKLKDEGVLGISAEGMERCDWVLLDAGSVIVHLFRPEVRAISNLEKMWGVTLAPVGGEAGLRATSARGTASGLWPSGRRPAYAGLGGRCAGRAVRLTLPAVGRITASPVLHPFATPAGA